MRARGPAAVTTRPAASPSPARPGHDPGDLPVKIRPLARGGDAGVHSGNPRRNKNRNSAHQDQPALTTATVLLERFDRAQRGVRGDKHGLCSDRVSGRDERVGQLESNGEGVRSRGDRRQCVVEDRGQLLGEAVEFLVDQGIRSMTHELTVTPAGDRWVP